MSGVLIKSGNLGQDRQAQREDHVEALGEGAV